MRLDHLLSERKSRVTPAMDDSDLRGACGFDHMSRSIQKDPYGLAKAVRTPRSPGASNRAHARDGVPIQVPPFLFLITGCSAGQSKPFLTDTIASSCTGRLVTGGLAESNGGIAQLARAVALQAIGLGFESPYLQCLFCSLKDRASRCEIPEGVEWVG